MRLSSQIDLLANRKLHARIVFQGLPVSVENRAGSTRSGTDPGGKPWHVKMTYAYGYIRRTTGTDGDHLDCFIGPHKDAKNAYVVHIRKPPDFRAYDEDKCFLGFDSPENAKRAFMMNYTDPKFFGSMDTVPMEKFKHDALASFGKPTKLAAAIALSASYGGPSANMAHMESIPTAHPPSLRNPQRIPTDSPWETDDRFGDVSRRRKAEKFRFALMKKHGPGQRDVSVGTTSIGWQPIGNGSVGVGLG